MIRITSPVHGEVLTHRNGQLENNGLVINVHGEISAPLNKPVFVNGNPATVTANRFHTPVKLTEEETDIVVSVGVPSAVEHKVRVLWIRHSRPRYRFSIDDNIFFLRDLCRERPKSIFDHFYLRGLRELNRRYGCKFVLNMFYATAEGDFSLKQAPDCWRSEFDDNASWLKLAFHAYAEFPDRPYQHTTPEKLAADYDLVAGEILRFSGERAYCPTSTVHWAMVAREAWHVLAERGSRLLSGYFIPKSDDNDQTENETLSGNSAAGYDINYCMDNERSAFLSRHDLLKDFDSGIIFSRFDIVCNLTPVDQVDSVLRPLMSNPDTAEVMDLMTHEQYFWKSYFNYLPDHFDRCERAIRFCAENGYEPTFLHEGLAGVVEPGS